MPNSLVQPPGPMVGMGHAGVSRRDCCARRGAVGGDSDGLVRYWRVPRGRCSLGSARTSKLVISLRRVIVRWVLWRAFPLRSISRFGATPHGVLAGIGSGLARELHSLGLTNRLGYYGLVTLGDWGTVYQRLSGDTIKLPFGGWRCGPNRKDP